MTDTLKRYTVVVACEEAAGAYVLVDDAIREIERALWEHHAPDMICTTCKRMEAELSTLRQAVGLATTCVPTMLIEPDKPIEMMQQVCAAFKRLEARVRELTKPGDENCARVFGMTYSEVQSLKQERDRLAKRVRELDTQRQDAVNEFNEVTEERDRLRGLIGALPLMESVNALEDKDHLFHIEEFSEGEHVIHASYLTKEMADALAALLRERQGIDVSHAKT